MKAVLLTPAFKYQKSFLSDGIGGSRAPIAYLSDSCLWVLGDSQRESWSVGRECSLVLAWDWILVPDGIFRAWNWWSPDGDPEFLETGWTCYDVLAEALDSTKSALWLARSLERMGYGSVVVHN
jgi:hypothetical protein